MDIVINVIPLYGKLTGVGKYTYYITKYLVKKENDKFYFYTPYGILENLNVEEIKKNKIMLSVIEKIKMPGRIKKILKILLEKHAKIQTKKIFDIYFEPNFVPISLSARKIIATVHDLSFLLYPEWHPEERVKYIGQGFMERTLLSDVIITPSNYIKNELLERFPELEGKVFPIHLGVDKDIYNPWRKSIYIPNLPNNYILYVGSIEPRKNLKNLLKAYAVLPKQIREEYPLLLAGFEGWKNDEIKNLLQALYPYVKYLGYVNEETLAELYRRATFFIYPSFYEGFGLPPIEAMACGCPVIVTHVASLPEVCGDAAFYINDPSDEEEIAWKMEVFLESSELRNKFRLKGIEHTKKFDWRKSAEEHYKLFKCAYLVD